MHNAQRRSCLTWSGALALGGAVGSAWAARPLPARAESPHLAIATVVRDSGLAARWGSAMKRDLGWAARWEPLEDAALLSQLEAGTVDAGIFLSHPEADRLDREGLIHDRRTLARTDVLLVGPADDPAGIRAERDPAQALRQVLAAQAAGAALWRSGLAGSALAALADQLTQGLSSKGLAPAPGKVAPTTQALAYRLTTLAAWGAAGTARSGLKVWLQGDARLSLKLQVARSFRAKHAGAPLLMNWLQGPIGTAALRRGGAAWQVVRG